MLVGSWGADDMKDEDAYDEMLFVPGDLCSLYSMLQLSLFTIDRSIDRVDVPIPWFPAPFQMVLHQHPWQMLNLDSLFRRLYPLSLETPWLCCPARTVDAS